MKNEIKKQMLIRGFGSMPTGIAVGFLIPLVISIVRGSGQYIACSPALSQAMGSEVNGVILQVICTALLGASFGLTSTVYMVEHWSLFRQALTYFLINGVVIKIVAIICKWVDFSILSVIGFLIQYAIAFVIIWFIIYLVNYKNIRDMNSKIK